MLNKFFNCERTVCSVNPASFAYSPGDFPASKAVATRNSAGDKSYSLPINWTSDNVSLGSVIKMSASRMVTFCINDEVEGNGVMNICRTSSSCRNIALRISSVLVAAVMNALNLLLSEKLIADK